MSKINLIREIIEILKEKRVEQPISDNGLVEIFDILYDSTKEELSEYLKDIKNGNNNNSR